VRDNQGKPYTVRYEAPTAIFWRNSSKSTRKVETLKATVATIQSTL